MVVFLLSIIFSSCATSNNIDTSNMISIPVYRSTGNNTIEIIRVYVTEIIDNENEQQLLTEYLNQAMLQFDINRRVGYFIFPERMSYDDLLVFDYREHFYIYDSVDYSFSTSTFNFKFINYYDEKISILRIPATIIAEIRYDERNRVAYKTGNYSIRWDKHFIGAHYANLSQTSLSPAVIYTQDVLNAFIEYWRIVRNYNLIYNAHTFQFQQGIKYILMQGFAIDYQLNNSTFNAYVKNNAGNRHEFVLTNYDGQSNVNTNQNEHTELIYMGMEVFLTNAGFMRMLPIFRFERNVYFPDNQIAGNRFNNLNFDFNFGNYTRRELNYGYYILNPTRMDLFSN